MHVLYIIPRTRDKTRGYIVKKCTGYSVEYTLSTAIDVTVDTVRCTLCDSAIRSLIGCMVYMHVIHITSRTTGYNRIPRPTVYCIQPTHGYVKR